MDKVDLIIQQYPEVWKTRSAFFAWCKGVIRSGWNHAPQKLILLKKLRKQIPNPNPKGKKETVWGAECSICNETYPLNNIQVDHITEETASLTQIDHIQSCAEKLLLVTEEDLRLVCKNCHEIVSLSQRLHITFEEAKLEKEVIIYKKLKAQEQINVLTSIFNCDNIPSNSKDRVDLYRKLIKER